MLLLAASLGAAEGKDLSCPELHVSEFRALLDQVDAMFAELKVAEAARALRAAEQRVPCVVEIVRKDDVARFALQYAFALSNGIDAPEAERWVLLARSLDPTRPWPDYVPANHRVREFGERPPEIVSRDDRGFALPEGGGVFLDGRFLDRPAAEPGVPHLLQIGDATGYLVESTWQDGAAFPEDFLGEPNEAPLLVPRWYSAGGRSGKPPKPPGAGWSDARKSNLERAGGFAAIGATLFASALVARGAYDARPSNGLFYAVDGATAASAASGGVAIGYLGVAVFGR